MSDSTVHISSSLSILSKKDISDTHFRWSSLLKFLYLANTFSNNFHVFGIFSKIYKEDVRIFEFVLMQLFLGMPYMFMDCFIKQYTRRIDGFKFLNPLLKGISFGQFIQTGFWVIIESAFLADAVRYFVMTFKTEAVPWAHCAAESKNSSCLSLDEIIDSCHHEKAVGVETTAAHHLYLKIFSTTDRGVILIRCFIVCMVWLTIFFVSTVTDDTLIKLAYFAFMFRLVSTLVVAVILILSVDSEPLIALMEIMKARTKFDLASVINCVAYTYGVGFLGFYDFGSISPYTMVDTAVVIFSVVLTLFALIRSCILKVLFMKMTKCVKVRKIGLHYYFFTILPLGTEFVVAHKLYAFYVYLNIIISTFGYLSMRTLTMSKLLHTEFRSLKTIYLVGLICCGGFCLTLPIIVEVSDSEKIKGIASGINMTMLYLGGFKAAIIMWVYGVERFSTDIQFWLGFRPTRYWTFCWAVQPIFLLVSMVYYISECLKRKMLVKVIGFTWFAVTVLIVAILHIKTISKYLVRNNLASLFLSTVKYGPPDPVDRLKRRNFSETIQLRRCKHNCQVIDDLIDCNHVSQLTLAMDSRASSIESLTTELYKAEGHVPGTSIKNPSLLDIAHHHY